MNDNLIEVEWKNAEPSEIIQAKVTAALGNKDQSEITQLPNQHSDRNYSKPKRLVPVYCQTNPVVIESTKAKKSRNWPRSEKTGLRGFRPGLTQTGLYSHRRWLEA